MVNKDFQNLFQVISDGTIWTIGIERLVATRRRRLLVTFCDSQQPDQLVWLWNGSQKVAAGGLKDQWGQSWQDTLKEDLETMGVDWSDVRDTASDRARWRQLVTRDGNGSPFVTHDPCDPSHSWPVTHMIHETMTHDPWLLHHFIIRMGLGGAWRGGTGQPSRSWEQKIVD